MIQPKHILAISLIFASAVLRAQTITTYAGTGHFSTSADSCGPYGGQATATILNTPQAMRTDAAGNIYTFEGYCSKIIKIGTSGIITSVAGNGTNLHSGDGGPATDAGMFNIGGMNVDNAGNIYVLEGGGSGDGCWVRKIDLAGNISTIAGGDTAGFKGDGGPATAAQINGIDLAIDGAGNIYIADYISNRIRKINSAGIISTFAGNGTSGPTGNGDGGQATNASITAPLSISTDGSGNVYFCEQWNNDVRKVTAAGIISTVADSAVAGLNPLGVAIDHSGNVFISNGQESTIKKINTGGGIITVAGSGINGFSGDGGPALSAKLSSPWGIAIDGADNLFIADHGNYRIRKVSSINTGVQTEQGLSTGIMTIWPQPSDGLFNVLFSSTDKCPVLIVVTNILGQKITEGSSTTNQTIALKINAPSGIYFVTAIAGQERRCEKIILR